MKSGRDAKPPGFTMLELVLAILLLSLLVGMIFGTAQSSLSLGNAVASHQQEAMTESAFFEMLDRQLGELPGNARLHLVSDDAGTHYLSDVTIQNVPMSFSWGGVEMIPLAVQLSTVPRRDGFLDIVLRYYELEVLDAPEAQRPEPFAEVVLLSDIRLFEWRVLDGRSAEWLYEWEDPARLPLQVELVMARGAQGPLVRHVIWIVPKQNPEVAMRQLAVGGTGGGGQPDPE